MTPAAGITSCRTCEGLNHTACPPEPALVQLLDGMVLH